jgi:hypothetical protein
MAKVLLIAEHDGKTLMHRVCGATPRRRRRRRRLRGIGQRHCGGSGGPRVGQPGAQ